MKICNVCMMQKEKQGCKLNNWFKNNDILVNTPKASMLDLGVFIYINPIETCYVFIFKLINCKVLYFFQTSYQHILEYRIHADLNMSKHVLEYRIHADLNMFKHVLEYRIHTDLNMSKHVLEYRIHTDLNMSKHILEYSIHADLNMSKYVLEYRIHVDLNISKHNQIFECRQSR